jgi:hypothetical protein
VLMRLVNVVSIAPRLRFTSDAGDRMPVQKTRKAPHDAFLTYESNSTHRSITLSLSSPDWGRVHVTRSMFLS